ncbi:hypothetical protein GCM10009558_109270 [Virgisporangium aurantiacum]
MTGKLAIVVGCDDDDESTVFATSPAGWADLPPTRWPTVACLVTDDSLVNVGVNGQLQRVPWAGGEIVVTELPGTPALPLRVQGARRVGGRFYVCGLFRQVFASPDAVVWTAMNDGLAAGPDEELTGLSNVAGHGATLVAVGVHGTVFRTDGGPWRRVPAGVRAWLKDVARHVGAYWICGKGGVLLVGDAADDAGSAGFSRVATGTMADLRSLRTFREDLYVLGDRVLLRVEGTSVVPVPTPGPPVAIDVCDEAMWMVADASTDSGPEQRRLFVSADGRTFTRHE